MMRDECSDASPASPPRGPGRERTYEWQASALPLHRRLARGLDRLSVRGDLRQWRWIAPICGRAR